MVLDSIDILNFKNISDVKLTFSSGVNCFVGRNGMGKSNLLEAVYFLSMARPMQTLPESGLIRHGEDMLIVKGSYSTGLGGKETVSVGITRGKGKRVLRNGKEYGKLSEHIGRFPIVAVTPSDVNLVQGSGEVRRKLIDTVISQTDRSYLSQLIRYTRGLESRNRMLRAGVRDKLLFESVEMGMAESAQAVFEARREWTQKLVPVFRKYYAIVSGGVENVNLKYSSALQDGDLMKLLDESRQKDTVLGFTSTGIHRDDLSMLMGDYSLRRVGSQGQIKSYSIALRLAVYDYIRTVSGITPILLLDDIFDKLDSDRVRNIMGAVSGEKEFGQIFITDTNREHLDETIEGIGGDSKLFEVANGTFKSIK